jgi:hypothetical protein
MYKVKELSKFEIPQLQRQCADPIVFIHVHGNAEYKKEFGKKFYKKKK